MGVFHFRRKTENKKHTQQQKIHKNAKILNKKKKKKRDVSINRKTHTCV